MTPSCECAYQKLQERLAAHWQAASNKKPNLLAMDKLLSAFLREMQEQDMDMIPVSASYLFRTAGVDNAVFFHNFRTLDGLILVTKGVIVKEIDHHINGPLGVFSYKTALTRLFDYLASTGTSPQDSPAIRLRFAALRFSSDFWEIALYPLYPYITKPLSGYSRTAKELFYSQYAAAFRSILKLWLEQNLAPEYKTQYIDLLLEMMDMTILKLEMVESHLKGLSVSSE